MPDAERVDVSWALRDVLGVKATELLLEPITRNFWQLAFKVPVEINRIAVVQDQHCAAHFDSLDDSFSLP